MDRGRHSQGKWWLGSTPAQSLIGILFPHPSNGDSNLCLSYCHRLLGPLPSSLATLSPFILPTTNFTDKKTKA